jgi:hypothetical protein
MDELFLIYYTVVDETLVLKFSKKISACTLRVAFWFR